MDIVGGIIAEYESDVPAQTGEDEAASLLYGDDSVRMASPDMNRKNLNYVILKSPTHQFLMDSYRSNLWNTTPQIKKKLRELCKENESMAFVIINGSRHFHGYLMIENDNEEYGQLNEEEAKLKPLSVRWMRLCHVPYHKTTDILNSLNDDLPVKLTSNGNEISADCANELLELLDSEPEETLETQKEKLQAYEELLTTIFSEQFEIPNEDSPQDGTEETNQMNVVEKDVPGNENGVRSENISTTANGIQENPKRRGRSRSQSAERGEFRRSKTGGSYLDLFDIVNMTYEEYLEAYRLLQMRAHEEFMMSMQQPPHMNMNGMNMNMNGMNMGPPGMMMMPPPHHMPPQGHFPPDVFFHHPNMGPPHMGPPHMMGGMMHGPPHGHGHMGGGRGGYRGGRGF